MSLLASTTALLLSAASPVRAGPPPALVIEHVSVIDVRAGAVRADQTVVVHGRIIERVANASKVRTPRGV